MGFKVLILSCTGSESTLGVAQLIMHSVGAPYDVILNLGNETLPLQKEDGSGKYPNFFKAIKKEDNLSEKILRHCISYRVGMLGEISSDANRRI